MAGTSVGANSKLSAAAVDDAATPGDGATVAVIIPTFNQANFLAAAIASILAQTRPAEEIIVVDDASTDGPASVVARFKRQSQLGGQEPWTVGGPQRRPPELQRKPYRLPRRR